MVSKFRRRFGSAGVVIAVVALVFAMIGGAYAASSGLSPQQKKEVKKIAKKFAGKQGPAGPQGPAGANGKDGAQGPTGPAGTNGTNGTNGATGATGPTGSPWTAGGTLPPGATETGAYFVEGPTGEFRRAVLSFPIPLASAPTYIKPGEPEYASKCAGSATDPSAAAGFLCVYPANGTLGGAIDPATGLFGSGPGKTGALVNTLTEGLEGELRFGTFAVTATVTP